MKVSEDDEIQFWWPCVISYFDASVAFSTIWVTISETFGLRKTLRPRMVFLDAGTHSSVHAILAAKKLSHLGTVVAFQPSSAGYRRLRLHVRQNPSALVRTEPPAAVCLDQVPLDGHFGKC
jgi:hypothetical protein